MAKVISIGNQSFESIRAKDNCFYIDKTSFIKEWWENKDTCNAYNTPTPIRKNIKHEYA